MNNLPLTKMTNYFSVLLFLLLLSCNTIKKSTTYITTDYELVKAKNQKALLVLFPCFPCDAEHTKQAFDISALCAQHDISILMLNFNKKLSLKKEDKDYLTILITNTINKHRLSKTNIVFGGFSSGGNISLLLGNHLLSNPETINPSGIFIVDSPVDILGLYNTSQKNLELNFSESSVQESLWIKSLLEQELGTPDSSLKTYEQASPYTDKTKNINNVSFLKKIKIRFYTEPDVAWWQKHAKNNYEDLNAFYIERLYETLKTEFNNPRIELIKTKNKGYKIDGRRHPHSWSIIDKQNLINWIMSKY